MSLTINIQRVVQHNNLPSDEAFTEWVNAAQITANKNVEITIRIVSAEEIQDLNRDYRNKDAVTNILSFSSEAELGEESLLLGDIVICADIVAKEAKEFGKSLTERWAHMVVHGCLHVQGYDHQEEQERQIMENKEIEVHQGFGFSNPYQVD